MERVLDKIKAVKGVEFANLVFGAYDVCFSVKEENLGKLEELAQNITKNNDVRAMLTLFETGRE